MVAILLAIYAQNHVPRKILGARNGIMDIAKLRNSKYRFTYEIPWFHVGSNLNIHESKRKEQKTAD
jgi:hypothetical protein